MYYNWKCCSFYPNNFGASALNAILYEFGVYKHRTKLAIDKTATAVGNIGVVFGILKHVVELWRSTRRQTVKTVVRGVGSPV